VLGFSPRHIYHIPNELAEKHIIEGIGGVRAMSSKEVTH
jgi:hypothetical protein